MRIYELFEYQLFKNDDGLKIYKNPSAKDIRLILKNSYILTQVPDLDVDASIEQLDAMDDEYIHYGGNIHNLDYPLRGAVLGANIYIVDSFDADHDDLARILRSQGYDLEDEQLIPLAIEKQSTAPRSDLEDYMIGAPQKYVNDLKKMPVVTRMKMPIGIWN